MAVRAKVISRRGLLLASAAAALTVSLLPGQQKEPEEPKPHFVCPMDPDVHSASPGKCPRCGMQLDARIVEPLGYALELSVRPANVPTGLPVEVAFRMTDPLTSAPVTKFEIVHEKLFHLFGVSRNLEWFLHDHPVLGADGIFRLPVTFPSAGMYELFADLYPAGGTPQWIPRFIYTKDAVSKVPLKPEFKTYRTPQRDGDVQVAVQLDPPEPFAGRETSLFFEVTPGDGLELWLGTYAHAFWVSHDLLDAEHTHPVFFGSLQFQAFFPRPGLYRFWIQFQRKGTLHTAKFDVPVIG